MVLCELGSMVFRFTIVYVVASYIISLVFLSFGVNPPPIIAVSMFNMSPGSLAAILLAVSGIVIASAILSKLGGVIAYSVMALVLANFPAVAYAILSGLNAPPYLSVSVSAFLAFAQLSGIYYALNRAGIVPCL